LLRPNRNRRENPRRSHLPEMFRKKIEEMDFYELLNLPLDAPAEEVEKAYLRAVATYHEGALASYGVLSPVERNLILERVEAAFQTLSDPDRRETYDAAIFPSRPECRQRAYFRKSTVRLEIEDAPRDGAGWDKVKSLFLRKRRKNGGKASQTGTGEESALLPNGRYYGEYLKLVRENRGLSREDIAATSGLSAALLKDLEEENYSALPRGKDPSSLLQLYARSLGLDLENGGRTSSRKPAKRT